MIFVLYIVELVTNEAIAKEHVHQTIVGIAGTQQVALLGCRRDSVTDKLWVIRVLGDFGPHEGGSEHQPPTRAGTVLTIDLGTVGAGFAEILALLTAGA